MIVWTPAVLSVLYTCVLYFCICTCSAQLSMCHMERRSRNMLIIVVIIISDHLVSDLCDMCCVPACMGSTSGRTGCLTLHTNHLLEIRAYTYQLCCHLEQTLYLGKVLVVVTS